MKDGGLIIAPQKCRVNPRGDQWMDLFFWEEAAILIVRELFARTVLIRIQTLVRGCFAIQVNEEDAGNLFLT